MPILEDNSTVEYPPQVEEGVPGALPRFDESHWQRCLAELGIPHAECLQARRVSPARRVYRSDGCIYKIELHPPRRSKPGPLAREYAIVERCRGIGAIPAAVRHEHRGWHELAAYEAVDATPAVESQLSFPRVLHAWLQMTITLSRLSWRGIAHNDVHLENILISSAGRCYLVDFDLARRTTRRDAFCQNLIRRRRRDRSPHWWPVWDLVCMLTCVRLRRDYVPYGGCIAHARQRLDQRRYRYAGSFALRAIAMRPWRIAGWRLLGSSLVRAARDRQV